MYGLRGISCRYCLFCVVVGFCRLRYIFVVFFNIFIFCGFVISNYKVGIFLVNVNLISMINYIICMCREINWKNK